MKPTRIFCQRCGRYPYAVMSAGIGIVEAHDQRPGEGEVPAARFGAQDRRVGSERK